MTSVKRIIIFLLVLWIVENTGCGTDHERYAQSKPTPAPAPAPTTQPSIEELQEELDMWDGIISRLKHPPLPCYDKPKTLLVHRPVLRKLHLMRPDLIGYPLDVRFYC